MARYEVSDPRRFGAIVREERHLRQMTQAQLADLAQVSLRWLIVFEQGHASAEIGKVFRVLQALDLHVAILTTEAQIPRPLADDDPNRNPHNNPDRFAAGRRAFEDVFGDG